MLDWIGSLRLRERSSQRVVLSLSRSTQLAGAGVAAVSGLVALMALPLSPWLALIPGVGAGAGVLLATLHKRMCFDRAAGVLEIEKGTLGRTQTATIPLFHLRAVVILARPRETMWNSLFAGARYIAYLDRRVGGAIYLDEAQRCAELMPIAEAIAEVAEVRLEYDAMGRVAG
ncbi:hypothetical protein [Haliangium ochraceum]|uniref:DUF304 domain-containing protein n=1 Tax=Haliangium ochraceum (strain DSM 14365 / JCM 11303 / SMP-2) TaxID=502025 RepID=D0LSF1_HALO1|nr:hypothetical protein [Haliangium ochraceum]ACY15650.1 hypothetical protein Hoch_3148 [Haliangium ochraceum DSM 14365]